jgi:hypothetical protein
LTPLYQASVPPAATSNGLVSLIMCSFNEIGIGATDSQENRMAKVVPVAWMPFVRQYMDKHRGENQEHPVSPDFPYDQSVLIRFPEGSQVLFKSAFVVKDETTGQLAVFTKRLGFHTFPLRDAEIELHRPGAPSEGA